MCIICKVCFQLSPQLCLTMRTFVFLFLLSFAPCLFCSFFLPVLAVLLVLSAQNAIRVSLSVNSSCRQHPQHTRNTHKTTRLQLEASNTARLSVTWGFSVGRQAGGRQGGIGLGCSHFTRFFCFFFYAKTAKCLLRNILRQPLVKEFGLRAKVERGVAGQGRERQQMEVSIKCCWLKTPCRLDCTFLSCCLFRSP